MVFFSGSCIFLLSNQDCAAKYYSALYSDRRSVGGFQFLFLLSPIPSPELELESEGGKHKNWGPKSKKIDGEGMRRMIRFLLPIKSELEYVQHLILSLSFEMQ